MRLNRTIVQKKQKEKGIKYVGMSVVRKFVVEKKTMQCQVRVRLMSFLQFHLSDQKRKTMMMIYAFQSRYSRSTYWRNKTNTNILFKISNIGIRKRISFQSVGFHTSELFSLQFILRRYLSRRRRIEIAHSLALTERQIKVNQTFD